MPFTGAAAPRAEDGRHRDGIDKGGRVKTREMIAMGIVTFTIMAANAVMLFSEYVQATF